MAIRIGVDPGWYEEQRYRRDQSLNRLIGLMQRDRERKAREAEGALGFISKDPQGTQGAAGKRAWELYGEDPYFQSGYGVLQSQEELMGRFMSGAESERGRYGAARDESGRLGDVAETGAGMSISPFPGFAPMGRAMESQATPLYVESQRDLIGMDPSGIRPSFEALSPQEQGFMLSNAKDFGLPAGRLLPDVLSLSDLPADVGAMETYARAGMADPSEVVAAARVGAGLQPSPGRLAEGEASAALSREGEENRARLSREQIEIRRQNAVAQEQLRQNNALERKGSGSGAKGGKFTATAFSQELQAGLSGSPPDEKALSSATGRAKISAENKSTVTWSNAVAAKVAKIHSLLKNAPPEDQQELSKLLDPSFILGLVTPVPNADFIVPAQIDRQTLLKRLDRAVAYLAALKNP